MDGGGGKGIVGKIGAGTVYFVEEVSRGGRDAKLLRTYVCGCGGRTCVVVEDICVCKAKVLYFCL